MDKSNMYLENKGYNSSSRKMSIPFLKGRPDRKGRISKDDMLNLKISLNTTSSVDDFIKSWS
jgi:hypothetical protein